MSVTDVVAAAALVVSLGRPPLDRWLERRRCEREGDLAEFLAIYEHPELEAVFADHRERKRTWRRRSKRLT